MASVKDFLVSLIATMRQLVNLFVVLAILFVAILFVGISFLVSLCCYSLFFVLAHVDWTQSRDRRFKNSQGCETKHERLYKRRAMTLPKLLATTDLTGTRCEAIQHPSADLTHVH